MTHAVEGAGGGAAGGVMARLREETAAMHASAEGHAFQRGLAKGELPRESYVRWLVDMLWIHRALERSARAEHVTAGSTASVFADFRRKEQHLCADLAYLGADLGRLKPTEAASAVAGELGELSERGRDGALELLGCHYVLEGSTNGNRFIARNIRRVYGLAEDGVRYLDAYGETQRDRWAEFKRDMDAIGFAGRDADLIVAGARRMFEAISRVSEDLIGAVPAEAAVQVRPAAPVGSGQG